VRRIIPGKVNRRSTGAEEGRTALCCTKSFSIPFFITFPDPTLLSSRNCNFSRSHFCVASLHVSP